MLKYIDLSEMHDTREREFMAMYIMNDAMIRHLTAGRALWVIGLPWMAVRGGPTHRMLKAGEFELKE